MNRTRSTHSVHRFTGIGRSVLTDERHHPSACVGCARRRRSGQRARVVPDAGSAVIEVDDVGPNPPRGGCQVALQIALVPVWESTL